MNEETNNFSLHRKQKVETFLYAHNVKLIKKKKEQKNLTFRSVY
jgi:hypothetical protein